MHEKHVEVYKRWSQNIRENMKSHVGHPAGFGQGGETSGGEYPHCQSVRLQSEYMGTRKIKVTLHGVPMDITEDRFGYF